MPETDSYCYKDHSFLIGGTLHDPRPRYQIYLYNIRAIEQTTSYLASILLSPQSQVGHAVAKHPTCTLTGIITASVGCMIILTVTNYDEAACFTRSLLLHLHATLLERRWSVYLIKIVILSNSSAHSCVLMHMCLRDRAGRKTYYTHVQLYFSVMM